MAKFDTDAIRRDNRLSDYLPTRGIALKADGREWRACCPFHAEKTASFTIHPSAQDGQRYHCFGCGADGDIIGFVEQWDGVDFPGACEILGGERTVTNDRRPVSPSVETVDEYAVWRPRLPPIDAPPILPGKRTPPLFNPKRPERLVTHYTPTLVHPYKTADGRTYGYVLRVDLDDGKITPALLWCENLETGDTGWTHRAFAEPRRLYGLELLAERPTAQVLVVEGEKCADAARRLLPGFVTVSWAGGGKAAGKTDWTPLAGRDVVNWPDNDEPADQTTFGWNGRPGLIELQLAAGAREVKVIARPSDDRPKGWDVADAEAEGWTRQDVLAWAKPRARLWTLEDVRPVLNAETEDLGKERIDVSDRTSGDTVTELHPTEQPAPQPKPEKRKRKPRTTHGNVVTFPGAPDPEPADGEPWQARMMTNADGDFIPKSMHNFVTMLRYHPDFRGVFALNEFTGAVVVRERPPWQGDGWKPAIISDQDVTMTQAALERRGLTPRTNEAGTAIHAAAHWNAHDPVRSYFTGLAWDGTPRLRGGLGMDGWLSEYMGVPSSEFARAVGMRWLVAAVARSLSDNPAGVKVDTMLILEGAQGKKKSSALEIMGTLGGVRYFTDDIGDINNKDAIMQMQGNVIVEIAELDAFSRAESETIKKYMSRKVDRFRPPYGKHIVTWPRRSILAGTCNPSGAGYFKDPTGARRFWPVRVESEIDLTALERDRDQLWAEAVHLYLEGEQWWLTADEEPDALIEQKLRYQEDAWADPLDAKITATLPGASITISRLLTEIGVPVHMHNQVSQNRVAHHLKSRDYIKKRRGGMWVYVKGDE